MLTDFMNNFCEARPTASRPTSPPSNRAWQTILATSSTHIANPYFSSDMDLTMRRAISGRYCLPRHRLAIFTLVECLPGPTFKISICLMFTSNFSSA